MNKISKVFRVFRQPGCGRALLSFGVAATVEHQAALSGLNARTVVDVGANRGQFALLARGLFPDSHIISFEPLSSPVNVFRKVFAKDANAELHALAIGPESRKAQMHVSAREDSSSLLGIGQEQTRVFPGTEEKDVTEVEVSRLSDRVDAHDIVSPALLKLDVQGFELSALEGCEELLPRFAWIYCECSFVSLYEGQALADEVIAWLRDRRFRLVGVYNMSYDRQGKAVQADFLFELDEEHSRA